jgi:Sec-independent protein translocase protein TatA
MMNFGPLKILFTALAALVILGPKRLPEAIRSLGRTVTALRKAGHEVSEELKSGLDDPVATGATPRPATEPHRLPPPPEELRPGPRG